MSRAGNPDPIVIRADARGLPLPDASVDLVVTSPPYFGLRSYTDAGEHYGSQIGSETTPQEYLAALLECTREWVRVLKPSGSIFVNLGDSYSSGQPFDNTLTVGDAGWLAGLIDADGTITVRFTQQPTMRAPTYEGIIAVEQMDREAVERAAAITGRGNIATVNGSRGRPMYRWTVSTQQARWVAERIWPWLRIKQRQALAIAELGRHREQHSARGRWNPIQPEWITYRQAICDAVRAWNARQPSDWEPPLLPVIELPVTPRRVPPKSLTGLPWRYALACMDDLGLILRRDIVWHKRNSLPESVADRCRSSHEYVFHLVKQPRYYSAIDEIREPQVTADRAGPRWSYAPGSASSMLNGEHQRMKGPFAGLPLNPLGKLPGSVWDISSQPLVTPAYMTVGPLGWVMTDADAWRWAQRTGTVSSAWPRDDSRRELRAAPAHFAAFPMELPRRIIAGWSPPGVCVACGEGRRPVSDRERIDIRPGYAKTHNGQGNGIPQSGGTKWKTAGRTDVTIIGYACACPAPDAPTRPAVVLDPFGGTSTTALVAAALGRTGISVDRSADYCRLARWRTSDPGERAKAMQVPKPPPIPAGMDALFGLDWAAS